MRTLRHGAVFVGFFLVLWGAFEVYNAFVKDRIRLKRWGEVEAGLVFRSGQVSQWRINGALADHGIGAIVDLTGPDPGSVEQQAELAAAAALGVVHERFPLLGNGIGRLDVYADAVAAVHRSVLANRPVLVHCAAGSQRTGGVIALYRLFVQGADPADVFVEMQRYRWDPMDDAQMLIFLNANMADLAQRLLLRGVIDRVPDELPFLGPAAP